MSQEFKTSIQLQPLKITLKRKFGTHPGKCPKITSLFHYALQLILHNNNDNNHRNYIIYLLVGSSCSGELSLTKLF